MYFAIHNTIYINCYILLHMSKSKVIRIKLELIPKLTAIDSNINNAITKLIDNTNVTNVTINYDIKLDHILNELQLIKDQLRSRTNNY